MREIPLDVGVRGKKAAANVTLKDVLLIPELPGWLLSSETLWRNGEEFEDSGRKESYPKLRQDKQEIPLPENRGYLAVSASLQGKGKHAASAHVPFANKKQRLTPKHWHNTLRYMDLTTIKNLDKCELIDVTDTKVVSEIRCNVCKKFTSEALIYGRGGRSPKAPSAVHTDLEGRFRADVTGMKYFQFLVDEASRDKCVVRLETPDAATDATGACIHEGARKGVAIECASEDGAGDLRRSVTFQRMLVNRGIKWR